jgi:hypothetical protein
LRAGCTDFGCGATDHANHRHLLPFLRATTESQALHSPHRVFAAYNKRYNSEKQIAVTLLDRGEPCDKLRFALALRKLAELLGDDPGAF